MMSSSFGRAFDDGERVGPNWFERDLELKKTEMQLEKIMEVLEEQRKELRKAVENVEKDVELPEVHLGRKDHACPICNVKCHQQLFDGHPLLVATCGDLYHHILQALAVRQLRSYSSITSCRSLRSDSSAIS